MFDAVYSKTGIPCHVYEADNNELKAFVDAVGKTVRNPKTRKPDTPVYHIGTSNKRKLTVVNNLVAAFDIETTVFEAFSDITGEPITAAFTYCMQFAINDFVYICRTWEQVIDMFAAVATKFRLNVEKQMLVLVHNLGYEYSFFNHILSHNEVFGKSRTKPISMTVMGAFLFRDSMMLSGGSLQQLCKDYNTNYFKTKEDFNYSIKRTSKTPLKEKEYKYVCVDVLSLTEFGAYLMQEYCSKGWLPMTSTQIVEHSIKDGINTETAATILDPDELKAVEKSAKKKAEKATKENHDAEVYVKVYNASYNKALISKVHSHIYGYTYTDRSGWRNTYPGMVDPEWFRPRDIAGQEIEINTNVPANLFQHLYYGGCTLAAPENTENKLSDLMGFDITSSYPYVMLAFNYAMSRFYKVDESDYEYYLNEYDFDEDSEDFNNTRWFCCATFTNVVACQRNVGVHPSSKCEFYGNHIEINGKLMQADAITIMLTDVNYDTFRAFYTFDEVTVHYIYRADAKALPAYLTDTLKDAYAAKTRLKKEHKSGTPEYTRAKVKVNTAYGVTVKSPEWLEETYEYDAELGCYITITTDYATGEVWEDNETERTLVSTGERKTSEKIFSSSNVLSPFWGIWVAGFARWRLCKMMQYIIENSEAGTNDFVYCDTDSLYMTNGERYAPFFEAESERARQRLLGKIDASQVEYIAENAENTLGGWTNIASDDTKGKTDKIKYFKTLGAKRYLKTYEIDGKEEMHAVIAGLPVHKLDVNIHEDGTESYDDITIYTDYCNKAGVDEYDYFKEGMDFMLDGEAYDIGKLNHKYVDTPATVTYEGCTMHSPTSTVLSPTGFKITYVQILTALAAYQAQGRKE